MPEPGRVLTREQVELAGAGLYVGQHRATLKALVEWYRQDPVSAARYCEEVSDPSGALLGEIRAAAAGEAAP